jgi:O-antigen/teichoic acid export membrane protein
MTNKPYKKNVSIENAVCKSSASGALKVSFQILIGLIIYAIIIRQAGSAALGSWVLLQMLVGYGGIVNLGMSPVIVKEIAKQSKNGKDAAHSSSLREALSFALLLAIILTILIIILFDPLLSIIQKGMEQKVSPMCIWIVLLGVYLRLLSSIYGSILAGYHLNFIVHLSQFLQLIIFALVFLLLHTDGAILLNLSLGFTVGYISEFLFIIIVLAHINTEFLRVIPTLNIIKLRIFLKKVLPYFLIDATLQGREPLLKCALFVCSGPASVGIFELASKVPTAIRQLFVVGLNALMPAFVYIAKETVKARMVNLGKDSLRYIVWGALGSLFLYGLNSDLLLKIWLGSVNSELLSITNIMTFWWMVTSLNVPAWWLGIGLDGGWTNTFVASTHFVYTLFLVGMSLVTSFSSLTLVIIWLIGGLLMQLLLYSYLEWKTKIIKKIYLSKEMLLIFSAFIMLSFITATIHSLGFKQSFSPNYTICYSIIFFYSPVLSYFFIRNFKWMNLNHNSEKRS